MGYEDRIVIPTPEGVLVEYLLAGLGSRMLAEVIDWLLRLLIVFAVLVGASVSGMRGTAILVLFIVLMLAAELVYDVAFEVWGGGRTPAKRWGSLRVVMAGAQPVTFVPSVIRNLLRLVDVALTLGIAGSASIIATEHNQRLGDLAAGTIVIREPRAPMRRTGTGSAAAVAAAPTSVLESLDPTGLTQTELGTVRDFLERRGELSAAARERVARKLADTVGGKVGGVRPGEHPPEALLAIIAEAAAAR